MRKMMGVALLMACGAGSVMAQSNVSLYGTLDAGVASTFKDNDLAMSSSYRATTAWGLRGTEDLGGGLKAKFQFESDALSLKDGSDGNGGFRRQAHLGLQGGFGEVLLGRTTTPQSRVMGTFDLNGVSTVNPYSTLGQAANGGLTGSRQNSQIQYISPTFGGMKVHVAYGLSADDAQKDWMQVAMSYRAGDLTLGAVLQPKSLSRQAKDKVNDYRTGFALGAKYQLGKTTVSALFQQDEQKSRGRTMGVGVAVPVGALQLGAQVARVVDGGEGGSGTLKGATAYELFANYSLSKRTSLYAIAAGMNGKAQQSVGAEHKTSYGVGVIHRF